MKSAIKIFQMRQNLSLTVFISSDFPPPVTSRHEINFHEKKIFEHLKKRQFDGWKQTVKVLSSLRDEFAKRTQNRLSCFTSEADEKFHEELKSQDLNVLGRSRSSHINFRGGELKVETFSSRLLWDRW